MAIYRMYPESEQATSGTWSLTGAATSWEAVDDTAGAPDDATTYAMGSNAVSARKAFNMSAGPEAALINSVTVFWRRQRNVAGGQEDQAGVNIAGIDYMFPGFAASPAAWTTSSQIRTVNPNTGLAWSKAVLDSILGVIEMRDTVAAVDSVQFTQFYLEVDYVPNPVKIGAARDVGSRRIRMFRRPVAQLQIEGPPAWGDVEIGDFFSYSHRGIPDTHAVIPGRKKWERRLYLCLGHTVDSARKRVRLSAVDVRDYLVTDWDTMISEDAPTTSGSGVARLNAGAGRLFTRASRNWLDNAATQAQGTRQVVEIGPDVEPLDAAGTLLQGTSTNALIRSSFKSAATGLTFVGAGVNGSAIAADATVVLFDPTVSGNSLKFTAGSPHAADLTARCTTDTAAFPANTICRASFDHRDDSGVAFFWRLQRLSDNFWFKDSDQTWQAGAFDNPLPVNATTPTRDYSHRINVGAGATALRLFVLQPIGGTASRINRLYHWQLEASAYATGRILTDGAAVTRALDNLRIENFAAKRVYNEARGTGFLQFIPEWDDADLGVAATRVLIDAFWDANNYDRVIFYSGGGGVGAGSYIYFRSVAGVVSQAVFSITVTRGTLYSVGWRWAGADGEENLAPYTISIFVNGTKGVDAVPAAAPTATASPYVWVGQSVAQTAQADGWLRHRFFSPFVFSDDEMVDLP